MEQFFLRLLDMSIRAGMVIGIILVVRAFFNLVKIPKHFVYLLWLIPFIRLICPWSPESPVGLIPETVEWLVMESPKGEMMQTIPEGKQFDTYKKQADRLGTQESLEPELCQISEREKRIQELKEDVESGERNIGTQSILRRNDQKLTLLSWGWLAGVILLLLYSICSYIRLRKKLVASMPVGSRIYLSDSIDTPFVMGIIKPAIYLPSGIGEQEKYYVIAHERVHIMRRDYLIKIAAFFSVCVHWFNPLAWAALFSMGKDMEMSCDEAVIRKLGGKCRREYASVLLDLTSGQQKICGMPLAFGGGNTKGRIENIMKYKKPILAVSVICVLGIAVLSAALLTIPEKDMGEKMADSGADNKEVVLGNSEIGVSEGTYYMKVPLGAEPLFVPCLAIGKDSSFTFSYDLASSYMPYGTYEIKGDVLTASTSDGLYQYQFKLKEDGTLVFLAKGSSEVKLFDDNLGIAVLDGSEFVKQTKREVWISED
ncbi:MAG: M56 family metallopeptidase [Lachnospiraceae bacterium]|nr:M56 family metallopeptidase [Lachnospiraceae bacterium]